MNNLDQKFNTLEETWKTLKDEFDQKKDLFEKEYNSWINPLSAKIIINECIELEKRYINLHADLTWLIEKQSLIGSDDYSGGETILLKKIKVRLRNVENRLNILNLFLTKLSLTSSHNNTRFAMIIAFISLLLGSWSLYVSGSSPTYYKNYKICETQRTKPPSVLKDSTFLNRREKINTVNKNEIKSKQTRSH